MQKWLFLFVLSVVTTFVSAQKTTGLKDFTEKFSPDTLPNCIDYSYDEKVHFGAIYHTDTVMVKDNDTTYLKLEDVFETNEDYKNDTALRLEKKLVKEYLVPDAKFIDHKDDANSDTLYSEPTNDYLSSEFYAISLLVETKKFYGVTYERLFSSGDLPSSEKYFCTYSKTGRFISRILIASFVFSGTGFNDSGARVPWFPEVTGCINKDLTIKVTHTDNGNMVRYMVQDDGIIRKLK